MSNSHFSQFDTYDPYGTGKRFHIPGFDAGDEEHEEDSEEATTAPEDEMVSLENWDSTAPENGPAAGEADVATEISELVGEFDGITDTTTTATQEQ